MKLEWKTQTHQAENAQFEQNSSLHVTKNLKFHFNLLKMDF